MSVEGEFPLGHDDAKSDDDFGPQFFTRVSTIPGPLNNRVFVVGPFATRVNFQRQQNRALNLVWALGEQEGYRNATVAVVGAGLAGMTAAIALVGLNCSVVVYETEQPIMWRQRRTSHRFGHPNINFWPNETIGPSTHFPFLNWMADNCEAVSGDIEEEWKQFAGRFLTFHHSTKVTKLLPEGNKVRLLTEDKKHEAAFDYVILSTGFEDETPVVGIPHRPYWTSDGLAPPRPGEAPIFISGTGDGGLIEALRFTHQAFQSGKLIVEIAERLSVRGSVRRKISEGEEEILREAKKRARTIDPRRPRKWYDDRTAVIARSNLYSELFDGAVSPDVIKCLDDSHNKTEPSVILVSNLHRPFSANAAPIHKLMLAYGIRKKKIHVIQGRIRVISGIAQVVSTSPTSLIVDRTILRHGAGFNLTLLSERQRRDIRTRQGDDIDKLDQPRWKHGSFADPRGPTTVQSFLREHYQRASRINGLQHGYYLDGITPADTGFRYIVLNEAKCADRPPPETIFGYPFNQGSAPQGTLSNRR